MRKTTIINPLKPEEMKRIFKQWMVIAGIALCAFSCSEAPEVDSGTTVPEVKYSPLKIHLSANNSSNEGDETRMLIGDIKQGRVYYNWNACDSIGAFLLNVPTEKGNHYAKGMRYEENYNAADFPFEANVPEGYKTTDVDLFVYYPYNPSIIHTQTGAAGKDYLAKGLTFRVPYMQTQLPEEVGMIECTEAMSRYAIAYDMVACEGTDGAFDMQHQTAYFRFQITGGVGEDGTNYAQEGYRLRRITVQAGKLQQIDEDHYALTEKVALAGTFQLSLDYNEETFDGSERMKLLSSGGASYVSTELMSPQPLNKPCYVFMSVSPDNLWDISLNAERYMQVKMEVEVLDNNNEVSKIITCTRNISLADKTVERGDFYDVSLDFSAPIDVYTPLDILEPSNAYILPAGGSYLFTAEIPGNGVLPYSSTWSDLEAEGIPEKLIQEGKNYKVDWLWASGTLFENYEVEEVLTECTLDRVDNNILVTINPEIPSSMLKGNLVVALYETDANGNFQEIVWSWLLWIAQPTDHHFYFPNTRPSIDLNNSDWHLMDRNLGAEEAGLGIRSVGLYYQMGRKDPFVGPSERGNVWVAYDSTDSDSNGINDVWVGESTGSYETAWPTNTLSSKANTAVFGTHIASWKSNQDQTDEVLAHRYPMHLLSRTTEQLSIPSQMFAWVHAREQAATQTKTLFDPCPPGYKIPTTREWDNLKNSKLEFTTPAANGYGPLGQPHYHYNNPWAYPKYSSDPWTWPSESTLYAYQNVQAFCDAGEYYEVDYDLGNEGYQTMGRRYHVISTSLYGESIVDLPATGTLTEAGAFTMLPSNITLWSSGRIDETYDVFEGYWFGIKGNVGSLYADNWAEWWGGEWDIYSIYTLSLFTNPFGAESSGLSQPTLLYDENKNPWGSNATINYAAPARCIRTYNATKE